MEKNFVSFVIAALIAMGSGAAGYASNVIINGQKSETEVIRNITRLETRVETVSTSVEKVLSLMDRVNATTTALAVVEIRIGNIERTTEQQERQLRALEDLRRSLVPRDQREYRQ